MYSIVYTVLHVSLMFCEPLPTFKYHFVAICMLFIVDKNEMKLAAAATTTSIIIIATVMQHQLN